MKQWRTVTTKMVLLIPCDIIVSIPVDPDVVSSVSLNQTSLTINVDDQVNLVATVNPSTALNKAVTWSSLDDNIASVSSTGLVNALAVGNTTITVTTTDGSFTATCSVRVNPNSEKSQ